MMMMEIPIQSEESIETTPEQSPCSRGALDRFNLSRSAGCPKLHSALNRVKVNLSNSCFANLRADKGSTEDDLTNLSWLTDNNLLKGLTSTPKSKSSSNLDDKSNQRITLKDYEMFLEEEAGGIPRSLSMTKFAKDTGYGKPPYSFSMLIFMAIESSPTKKLPVKDIYSWIMDNFRYFRGAPLGWKNSVRHNLSLNKCFKKVDRDKTQGVGKGALWCIDPESRPTLLQGMRKNQVLMSKINPNAPTSSFLTTPPPSPGNNDGYHSFNHETFISRGSSPNFDDKEFDAAAAMCTMSTPRELRAMEHERIRSHASTPTEDLRSSPTLLNRWRKYIEPLSDSDASSGSSEESPVRRPKLRPAGESGSTYTIANLLTDVSLHSSQSLKRSANGFKGEFKSKPEADTDESYDFGNETEEDEEDDVTDDEIDDNIKKLVERDSLGDSGYGEERLFVMFDHSYSKTAKRPKQSRDQKLGVSMEVQALLSLANEATKQLGGMRRQTQE